MNRADRGAPPEDLGALSTVLAARRPVEPRLIGFAYAPCTRPAPTAEDLIPLARCSELPALGTDAYRGLVDAGTALRSLRDGAATVPLLRNRGLWHLLWVDQDQAVERAVQNLETAAALSDAEGDGEGEEAARVLTDLAAAYLVRAAKEERPLDLILALDASGRALETSPDLPEALFNHALAMEALHLRNEARTAWEDFLDAEPTGPWAGEAREHLSVLAQPTVPEAWKAERPLRQRAAREGNDEEVRRLATADGTLVHNRLESRAAWNGRLRALTIPGVQADPRRLYDALQAIVGGLLAEGRPDLAVHFQNELLVQARAWNEPGPLADAFLTRSRIRLALGDDAGALADVDEAESKAAAVPDGEIKDRLEADLTAGRGRALVETDPGRAVAALSRAIERYRSIHQVAGVPRLQVSRARASLALGDVDGAEKDLSAAIREDERRWRDPKGDPDARLGLREEAQGAYDAMIAVRLDRRDDSLGALAWSDRARGRLLRSEDGSGEKLPTDRSALLRRVPAGVTAVEYAVLPDRVVLWVLGHEVTKVVRPLSQAVLSRRIDSLLDLIEARAPEQQIRMRAGALFDDLLRPVVDHAGPGDTLLVVPDRALHRLPFAALWDERAGSYLVERHAIAEAPSLAAVLRGPSSRSRAETPSTVLAVGASKFDCARFPELPSLPGAEEEARKIAALYPRPELLLGEAATPDAFKELAPGASVLHFAGHALVDASRPAHSELLLAPRSGNADGGTVTAQELRRLDLGGVDLVYLSDCRTVSALPIGTRKGPGGLARAALLAGAAAVVASRWEADDASALAMATAFHQRYRETGAPIAALQTAQQTLLADHRPTLHHPASWSGFSIQIGDGSLLVPTATSTQ